MNGWDTLRLYRIGIVRGVGSSEHSTADMPQVEASANADQMMLMLASGEMGTLRQQITDRIMSETLGRGANKP